jgi:hypothetical protein
MPRRRPPEIQIPLIAGPPGADAPTPGARNAGPVGQGEVDADEDEEEVDSTAADDNDEVDGVIAKLGKVMSAIGPSVPHLVSLVRGYPPAVGAAHRNAAAAEPEAEVQDGDDDDDTAVVTPAMVSHMILIAQQLGEDGALLRRVLQKMDRDGRRGLIEHLCSMTLEDAVADALSQLAPVKARMAKRGDRARRDVAREGSARDGESSPVESDVVSSDDGGRNVAVDADGAAMAGSELVQDDDEGVPASDSGATPTPPDLEARMLQVARHLTIPEVIQAQSLIAGASGAERAEWIKRLIALSPVEAAEVVRAELTRRAAG